MPRKTIYDRNAIINAAIELIERNGHEEFSVRNVADILGASTQPIYSSFSDSRELYKEVLLEIQERLLAQTRHPYSEYVFRNMGFGFVLFAKHNPNLFIAFFDDEEVNREFIDLFLSNLLQAMDEDQRFDSLSAASKSLLLEKMWTFSYGYAMLIIQGLVKNPTDENIKNMILNTGSAVIRDTLQKENS